MKSGESTGHSMTAACVKRRTAFALRATRPGSRTPTGMRARAGRSRTGRVTALPRCGARSWLGGGRARGDTRARSRADRRSERRPRGRARNAVRASADCRRYSGMDLWRDPERPFVIGHRGAAGVAPENTLASLEAAVDAGVDIVEFDVQPSLRLGHTD